MYTRILAAFYASPLAILPEKWLAIRAFLEMKARGEDVPPERVAEIAAARRADGVTTAGRVAILPVMGVLAQRAGGLEQASGGISAEAVGAALDSLVADRSIKAIVMAYDSPGGSVFGIPELAAKIRAARDEKKIVAIADSVAASAAYWLAAQASEVYVTPGGQVGSVGVFAAHVDDSKEQELAGRKTTYVTAGKYKTEGAPGIPLGEEALAEMQSKVDAYYGMFVSALAKGRGCTEARVEKDFGQGRMATAKEAVSKGMADGVCSMEQLLARLGADQGGEGSYRAMHAAARARAVGLAE